MQVLSPKDADLYRAAFAAQAISDWNSADIAISNITDRKLLGHVLADRYLRRTVTQAELRSWLAAYSDLPEAPAFYDKARRMPTAKASKATVITHPNVTTGWSSAGAGGGASYGFKSIAADLDDDSTTTAAAKRFSRKIEHLIRQGNSEEAKALFESENAERELSFAEKATIGSRIAASLYYDGQADAARLTADEALYGREPLAQNPLALWIGGLAAIRQNDILAASKFFTRLAVLPGLAGWDRAAADFWAYRTTKQTGDKTAARYWLSQAALQPQSFYGLLALHLLGTDETVRSWQMPEPTTQTLKALSSRPAGWRALALIQVGQQNLAESELQHLNPQGHRDLQEAMLAVAEQSHMPVLAMKLGGIATNNNGKRYDAALYPVPPWQPEHGFDVDRALMYALIRHESGFNPVAQSSQGACGLMQLMPATANLIANDNKKSIDDCSGRLLNPAYNMSLGQKYVKHLASQPMIGDNLMLLLAAYNGGPGNLAHWMDDNASRKDPLLFMESLPMRETRDYVQQVMVHYWNYCVRLKRPQTSLTQLANGQWPRVSLHEAAATPPVPALPRSKQADIDSGYKVASSAQ